MQNQSEKVILQAKQEIKNNINICSNIQKDIQKLDCEQTKQINTQTQFNDINKLLKNIAELVQKVKEFQQAQKVIIKQQISNKNNKQCINSNDIIKLADSRYNLVHALNALDESLLYSQQQAKQISVFEEDYLMKYFKDFKNYEKLSVNESQTIFKIISLISKMENEETIQNQPLLTKITDQINENVKARFQEKISKSTDTLNILNNLNFIADDMTIVQKYVSKCFPQEVKIFNIYEQQYRLNLEKRIEKDIANENELKQKFEIVTKLIEWISNYEQQIIKVDGQPLEFSQIKSKIMKFMPLFQDHMRTITMSFFQRSLEEDFYKLTIEQLDRCIEEGLKIELNFGVDSFNYLNKQIDTICGKLELYHCQAPHLFEQSISELDFNLNLTISTQVESNFLLLIEKVDYYLKLIKKNLQLQNFVYLSFSKLLIQNMINIYWNQICEEVKEEYKEQNDIIQLIYDISVCIFQELSPNSKKNNQIKVTSLFSPINNFELLAKRVENDLDILSNYLNNSSLISFSQSTISHYTNQFNVFINSIQTQNSKLKDIIIPIKFAFQSEVSLQIFDTIIRMRQEISKDFKDELYKVYQQSFKQNDNNQNIQIIN
ncbi:hypothetical protein ABPG74_001433 [Tetrahymena malaccensis]